MRRAAAHHCRDLRQASMSAVHIYTAPLQPLTMFVDPFIGPPAVTCSARRLYYCHECGRRRWAKNLVIQVFYDGSRIYCAEPHAHTVERVPYSVWSKRTRRRA